MDKPHDFGDLDSLLTKALARQTPQKPRRKPTDTVTPEELAAAERRVRARFYAPENWERTKAVVLIHVSEQGQETLLGNFAEYRNKLMKDCRKLVRETQPTAIGEIEYVKGENWLADRLVVQPTVMHKDAQAEEQREAICDIHLPELNHVFAPEVMVTVTLIWGGVAKIELMEETRFFDKERRAHLILPAGLDVMEAMSFESKQAVRRFLGI